jgi:uncharacterized protein YprB with RNaseH-like and TPR domain
MSEAEQAPVSHVDLYHKLGRLEALMETMMSSVSTFQTAIRDLHSRIDNLEQRQSYLEKRRASENGALGALVSLGKDFAVPVLAIVIAWMAARGAINNQPDGSKTEYHSGQHQSQVRSDDGNRKPDLRLRN